MRTLGKYLPLLLLLCLGRSGLPAAQTVFSTLHPRDGLSSKEVFCSYTDSAGFLWCGTATGLNRWDGSRFYVITPYSGTYPGLINEAVYAINEWNGLLWVGTAHGLSCLNRYESRFRTVPFVRGADTIKDIHIHRLLAADDKHFVAGTSRGLFVLRDGCMRPVSGILPGAGVLDSVNVVIYSGSKGSIWARADSSVYLLNPGSGRFCSRYNNTPGWKIFNRNYVTTLNEAPDGRVWFASFTHTRGLFCFDPATNQITEIPGFTNQVLHKLYNDRKGRLWISSTTPTASVLDTKTGRVTQLDPAQISYPLFHHVHEDRAGNVWFATASGLSKLASVQPLESYINLPISTNYVGAAFSLVNQLQVADTGHIWVCKDDGLYKMSLTTRQFERFAPTEKQEARENRIFDIQRINGTWWCGTGTGIVFFDEKRRRFTPFTQYPGAQRPWRKSVMWMRPDNEGYIWYASWVDAVYRFDPRSGESVRIADSSFGDIGTSNCLFGFLDRYGKFWVGFGDKGVRCWNAKTRKMYNPVAPGLERDAVSACIVYNMVEDERGGYWLATNRLGAVHLDSAGHILQCISLQHGLNTTAALNVWMQSGGRRLWIATSEGIQTYDLDRRLISAIDMDFGILVKDYCSVILGIGQRAYISINGKLAVVNLDAAAGGANATARPLITGVRVFEHERPVPPPDSMLSLRSNENFFAIDFSSPLHHDVQVLQYSYMLEGYDQDWVYCGRRQSASYTNVAPGNYKFRIRSTNELGEWQGAESEMRISISAPFWQLGWFRMLAIMLLAFGCYHLARYIYRRRRRRRIESTIEYFARSTHEENSVADICWDISRNCISQMGLEDCVVYLRDTQRDVLHQVAAYGPKNPQDRVIENPIEIPVGEGIVGSVAATGKAILVPDTRKDPRYVVDDAARLSELAVPIIHDGAVIGVIDTEHSRRAFYKDAHLKALTTIASISSNKIAEAQAEESVRRNERELLQIRSMLADSQLMALRTQMNPHFVFNCLNSIQECIVTGKYGEASHYLNKFSKLFRALLDNSGKPLIPLAEEIAVLELYLSLEHMRFEGSFDYSIKVDDELEAEEIMIPSMLLQPFVENALWHGLMHKEGERRLTLSFDAIPGDLFRCTIDDNGIGRERAAALKASRASGKSHISRGLQITTDRIALMQRRGQAASLRIIDKHSTGGKASGTTVIVELSAYLTTLEA